METKIPTFLIEKLERQYGRQITKKIIEGYSQERKVSLRVNTIKAKPEEICQQLQKENIKIQKVPWSREALIILNVREKEIQELEMYKKGEIYLQSLSSMLPPILLEPQPETDILDMAAAPGGKTTQIAALSKNQAHITACEMHTIRAERLKYNLEKQGATSAYVMVTDARKLSNFFSFDQILLDAPCSGSGTISIKNEKLKNYFTPKLIEKSRTSQLTLLKKAIEVLKKGKEMIYSTCSILQCENEEVIHQVLQEGKVEIVPIYQETLKDIPCLPTKIEGSLLICPDAYYEGFFVTKLRKK